MVATTNLFKILMKLFQHNNDGNLQPLVISCTQNKCINTNNNIYWVIRSWTKPQHQFANSKFGDGMNPTYKPIGTTLLHQPNTL